MQCSVRWPMCKLLRSGTDMTGDRSGWAAGSYSAWLVWGHVGQKSILLSVPSSDILSPHLLPSHHLSFAFLKRVRGKKTTLYILAILQLAVHQHSSSSLYFHPLYFTPTSLSPHVCKITPSLLLVSAGGKAFSYSTGSIYAVPSAWGAFPCSSG